MKKPLIELLPKSLVEIIIELKYLRNNKKTYQSNITNKKVVKINYNDIDDIH
jgi:hypothetical protein